MASGIGLARQSLSERARARRRSTGRRNSGTAYEPLLTKIDRMLSPVCSNRRVSLPSPNGYSNLVNAKVSYRCQCTADVFESWQGKKDLQMR